MSNDSLVYEFLNYEFNVTEKQLYQGNQRIELQPTALDLLLFLLQNAGNLATTETVLNEVWSNSFVEEQNVKVQISALRKALGKNRNIIVTVPRQGYKLVCEVKKRYINKSLVQQAELPISNSQILTSFINNPPEEDVPQVDNFWSKNQSILSIGTILFSLLVMGCILNLPEWQGEWIQKTSFSLIAALGLAFLNCFLLLLEVSYEFDQFKKQCSRIIPAIFLVSFVSTFTSLKLVDFYLETNLIAGFLAGGSSLILGLLLCLLQARSVLPDYPITKATKPTHPAFAAYWKNVFGYFLGIYWVFAILLFGLMFNSAQQSHNLLIPVGFFILFLISIFIHAIGTMDFIEKLKRKESGFIYFCSFALFRALFGFSPALIFTIWYFLRNFNGI